MRVMRRMTGWAAGLWVALLVALSLPAGASAANIGAGVSRGRVVQAPPVIVRLSAHPGKTGALLRARIRPEGLATTYRFYLELCTGSECIDEVLIAEGTIAATVKSQTVQASTYSFFSELGLPLDSTWEYSVTATNTDGGTERTSTFKTRR